MFSTTALAARVGDSHGFLTAEVPHISGTVIGWNQGNDPPSEGLWPAVVASRSTVLEVLKAFSSKSYMLGGFSFFCFDSSLGVAPGSAS